MPRYVMEGYIFDGQSLEIGVAADLVLNTDRGVTSLVYFESWDSITYLLRGSSTVTLQGEPLEDLSQFIPGEMNWGRATKRPSSSALLGRTGCSWRRLPGIRFRPGCSKI